MYIEAPGEVRRAVMSPASRIYSRIEFFERDGKTPFRAGEMNRLISGSVSVDQNRDERRTFDVEIENYDDSLELHPKSIWYDKIIKIYKGIMLDAHHDELRIGIVGDFAASGGKQNAEYMRTLITRTGLNASIVTGFNSPADADDYDVIIESSGDQPISKRAALQATMDRGRHIITVTNRASNMLHVTSSTSLAAGTERLTVANNNSDLPGAFGWDFYQYVTTATSEKVTGLHELATTVATFQDGSPAVIHQISRVIPHGDWTHLHMVAPVPSDTSQEFEDLLYAVIVQASQKRQATRWEACVGTFEIDKVDQSNFPLTIKLSGRDRTKTLMGSGLEAATAYAKGTSVAQAIRSLAANAGIRTEDMTPNLSSYTLSAQATFEAGTTRWEAITKLAEGETLEVFINNEGALVLQEFQDPVNSPVKERFQTGPEVGNLVSFSKSSDDTEMYNVILAMSEDSGSDTIPVSAVAKNTNPKSPTSTVRIGARMKKVTSALFNTKAKAQKAADQHLRTAGLHTYSISIDTLQFFWLEAGQIIQFIPADRDSLDPTRYLLTDFSIPLGLENMSITAKRVTLVG